MQDVTAPAYYGKQDHLIVAALSNGVTADRHGEIYLNGDPMPQFLSGTGYAYVRLDGKRLVAHRLIWIALNGAIPEGFVINHRNFVRSDNRLMNLEAVPQRQNVAHALGSHAYNGVRPADVDALDPEWFASVLLLVGRDDVTSEDIAALRDSREDEAASPYSSHCGNKAATSSTYK